MWCQWELWCNTNKAITASRAVAWARGAIGRPFHACLYQYDIDIPGIRARFYTKAGKRSRSDCIVEALTLCERLGSNWVIEGTVRRNFSLFSQDIRRNGIVRCECYPLERTIGKGREEMAIVSAKARGRAAPAVLSDSGGWNGEMKFGDVVLVSTKKNGLCWSKETMHLGIAPE